MYILSVLVALAAPASGGVVQTLDARLEGDVAFADGRVEVGGKAVAWDTLVYVVPQGTVRTLIPPGAVRLAGGEVWRGDVIAYAQERLALRSAILGSREVPIAQVAEIEFSAVQPAAVAGGDAPPPRAGSGVLCCEKGEPVPGTLLWIDPDQVAIDSPLGVLKMPRDGAVRYTFGGRPKAEAKPAADRVGLVDGSLVCGTARPAPGGVKVEHPVLGTLTLGAALVRYVERADARVTMLCDLAPGPVTQTGILDKPSPAGAMAVSRGQETGRGAACLSALRLQPKTVVSYAAKPAAGKKVRLVGRVGPIEGARGDAHLKVRSGRKVLLEQDVGPGAAVAPLALELADSGELVLEVDYGPRLGFPCGVVIEDPMLVQM